MSKAKMKIGKNSKLKSFLLFLLLATLFWFLAKFSKEYTSTVSAKLNYTNIPVNTLLAEDNSREVSFDMFANGFEFLFFKLKQPAVDVPVSKYYEKGDGQIQIASEDFSRLILEDLNNSNDLHNLSIDTLVIKLNTIIFKNVAVVPDVSLSFKEGFKQIGSIQTAPDSIKLSGPAVVLDTISHIATISAEMLDLEQSTSLNIAIKKPENLEIKYEPSSVLASVTVGEFTQKRLQVPVRLENVPETLKLKLIPEMVTIVFNVALEDFKNINPDDFTLVCNYLDRNQTENFFIPKITEQPERVYDVELETKKVDYLIFK